MKKKIRNGGLKKKYMYIEINLFIQYITGIILFIIFSLSFLFDKSNINFSGQLSHFCLDQPQFPLMNNIIWHLHVARIK